MNDDQEQVRQITSAGFAPDLLIEISDNQTTPLFIAITYRKVAVVGLMLKQRANLDLQVGPGSETALMCAVQSESAEIVGLLLGRGVDKHLQNRSGETALTLAGRLLKQKETKKDQRGI